MEGVSASVAQEVKESLLDEHDAIRSMIMKVPLSNSKTSFHVVDDDSKEYVVIRSENTNANIRTRVDRKQRWTASYKLYKKVYNRIVDTYYPNKPPYDLRMPKIYYMKDAEDCDVVIQEYIV